MSSFKHKLIEYTLKGDNLYLEIFASFLLGMWAILKGKKNCSYMGTKFFLKCTHHFEWLPAQKSTSCLQKKSPFTKKSSKIFQVYPFNFKMFYDQLFLASSKDQIIGLYCQLA